MDPLVDDWQAASRVKQQAAAYPVGTKILKYFPDLGDNDWGWYRGKVMQVDAKDGIYLVRYNDGDKEELDHAEVGRYLRLGKEDIVGKKWGWRYCLCVMNQSMSRYANLLLALV